MKQFKTCKLIVASFPDGGLLDENQCEFEHEVSDKTLLSLPVQPIPPIYKAGMRLNPENKEVIFLSSDYLKLAS